MASYAQLPMEPQLEIKNIINNLVDNLQKDHEVVQFFSPLKIELGDEALFKHVYQYLARYQLMPKKPYASKNDHFSYDSKIEGNAHFKAGKYKKAMHYYREAIKFATTSETISVAYANRSAALYHLKKYSESLIDIGRAIEAGYDEKLMPKLLLRKKQCEEALELTRAAENAAKAHRASLQRELFRPPQKRMAGVSCASASLEISHFESMGRSVMATEDIQPGQVLVVEDPYVTVSGIDHFYSRCNFCCTFNYAMIPCESCTYFMYCNEECRTKSWNEGHKFECGIMSRLSKMHFCSPALASLRILLKARCQHSSWDELFKTVDSVDKKTDPKLESFTLDTDSDRYAAICMFKAHPEKWEQRDIVLGCISSALILYMLKEYTTFLADLSDKEDHFWRTGGLLFHHFMSVQMNSHDINIYIKDTKKMNLDVIEIANGIYPFFSLFNHACVVPRATPQTCTNFL